MKFSDMMNKRDRDTTEVAETDAPAEANAAPPVPEAPIRFGANRTELDDAVAAFGTVVPAPTAAQAESVVAPAPAPVAAPVAAPAPPSEPAVLAPPSISDVVAELAPRPTSTPSVPSASVVTDQQIDTSAWLDDINSIDDDLLPH